MSRSTTESLAGVLRELAVSVVRDSPQHELSRTAAAVLSRLLRQGPHRITALSDLEAVSQPSMTGLVQRLEGLGYLTRSTDPVDRRATLVAITQAGTHTVEARREMHERAIAQRLSALGATDLDALSAALPAITRLIDTSESNVLA